MKIGILTYHYSGSNYGTVLQALALETYIKNNIENDCEIIDYRPRNEYVGKKLIITRFKRSLYYIAHANKIYTLYKYRNQQQNRERVTKEFIEKHMTLSKDKPADIYKLSEACKLYDQIIIGSDQTWNPNVSEWKVFLLDYVNEPAIKKIAYAPSIGTGRIEEEYRETYKNALLQFSSISCRETEGAKLLTNLLETDVPTVLDPTLLLSWDDWKQYAETMTNDKPYIITYFLGDNPEHRKIVKELAKQNNYTVVTMPMAYREMKEKKWEKVYCNPGQFLTLIKNAELVCTDSFHGTIFSINFNKNFISFPKRKDNERTSDNQRLYDVLSMFSLEDRLYREGKIPQGDIDYKKTDEIISELRRKSKDYLIDAIENRKQII